MIVRFLRASLLPPGEYFTRKYRLATVASAAWIWIHVAGLDYSEIFIFPTLALEYPEVVVR
jgi:hypothetical protein